MDTFAELQNYPDVIISGTNSLVPRLCSPSWGEEVVGGGGGGGGGGKEGEEKVVEKGEEEEGRREGEEGRQGEGRIEERKEEVGLKQACYRTISVRYNWYPNSAKLRRPLSPVPATLIYITLLPITMPVNTNPYHVSEDE